MNYLSKHKLKLLVLLSVGFIVFLGAYSILGPPKQESGRLPSLSLIDNRLGSHFSNIQAVGDLDYVALKYNARGDYLIAVGSATPSSLNSYATSLGLRQAVAGTHGFDGVQLQKNISQWQRQFNMPASILYYPTSMNTHGNEAYGEIGTGEGTYRLFFDGQSGFFILFVAFDS